MSFNDLSAYRSYTHWMNTLTSDSTRRVWTHCLRNYCNWRDLSPDELITKRERDLAQKDSLTLNDEELQLHRYMLYLEYQDSSSSWRRVCWTAVRNFFQKNYLPLKIFRGEGPKVDARSQEQKECTINELNLMLKSATTRERALILFLSHTGLPTNIIARLSVGDLGTATAIKPVRIKKLTPPVRLQITNRKFGIEARTFISNEAWTALKKHLNQRRKGDINSGTRNDFKIKIPPEKLNDSSPLFRSYGKWGEDRVPVIKNLEASSMSALVKKVSKRAGVYRKGFSAYALRRFFKRALINADVNSSLIRTMMGYKIEKRETGNREASWKRLQRAYKRAEPYLVGKIQAELTQRSKEELLSELEKTKIQLKKERARRIIYENTSIKDKKVLNEILKRCMKAKDERAMKKILTRYEREKT